MSSDDLTLDQLRESLTPEQRNVIDTAFDYEQQYDRAIPAWVLFERCGGESIVSAALKMLPQNATWSSDATEGKKRYTLQFLGYLLSKRGPELQSILANYLEYVRSKLRLNPELSHVDFAGLTSEAGFTDDQFEFFREFIFKTPFHNEGGGGGSGIPPNVDKWIAVDDLSKYVAECALPKRVSYIDVTSSIVVGTDSHFFVNRDYGEPEEIRKSLELFQRDHADPQGVMFVMMRFGNTPLHLAINQAISDALTPLGMTALRADSKWYHDDLFYNILTYLHGCGSGVAVFERLEEETFNPNVAFEVGYMLALGKPVCLLKDRTLKTLHADLAGKLYRQFDAQKPSTVSEELEIWLRDKSFI